MATSAPRLTATSGSLRWRPADVDADGDLDLAVLGYSVVYNVSATEALLVLRNDGLGQDGRWRFTPQPMDMGELYSGSSDLAWGDFDGMATMISWLARRG
jgi:hypothetical protein